MLNETGQHRWRGIAPLARIEAAFSQPDLRWQGEGYLDSNAGDAPLEDGFSHWTWSRAELNGGAAVLYDAARRDGSHFSRGLLFDRQGKVEEFSPPPINPCGLGMRKTRVCCGSENREGWHGIKTPLWEGERPDASAAVEGRAHSLRFT